MYYELVISFLMLVTTENVSANVKGPPTAMKKELREVTGIGEEIRIYCPISGFPAPIIEWTKNGENIDFTWIRMKTKNNVLRIKRAQEEDSGEYVCKGVNGFGKVEVRVFLVVIDPYDFPSQKFPEIMAPQLSMKTLKSKSFFEKYEKDSIQINCESDGFPHPEMYWYKDETLVVKETIQNRESMSTLLLKNLQISDTSKYTCQAKNMLGSVKKEFTVHVKSLLSEKPHVIGGNNVTVNIGEVAQLQCHVKSTTHPTIKWLTKQKINKSGNELTIDIGDIKYQVITNFENVIQRNNEFLSEITIKNVQKEDEGLYICFVTNDVRSLTYHPLFLKVNEPYQQMMSNLNDDEKDTVGVILLAVSLGVISVIVLSSFVVFIVLNKRTKQQEIDISSEASRSLMHPSFSNESNSTMTTVSEDTFDEPLPYPYILGNTYSHKSENPPPSELTYKYVDQTQNIQPQNMDTLPYSVSNGNLYEVPYCYDYIMNVNKRVIPNESLYTISNILGGENYYGDSSDLPTYPYQYNDKSPKL